MKSFHQIVDLIVEREVPVHEFLIGTSETVLQTDVNGASQNESHPRIRSREEREEEQYQEEQVVACFHLVIIVLQLLVMTRHNAAHFEAERNSSKHNFRTVFVKLKEPVGLLTLCQDKRETEGDTE